MTRIFDALKKAQASLTPPAHPPLAPPAPAPAFARESSTRAPERRVDPLPDLRQRIVPLDLKIDLPEEVVREMTSLRVNLEATLSERAPRVIIFLSAQGGEGTSTVAAQFAISLAKDTRLRTLLVDAHVRRSAPWLRSAGSVHPLRTAAGDGERARQLDVLPLSEAQLQAGALSPSEMRATVDAAAPGYDWIVLDGAPVLEAPDAAPLAAIADGVLVVVHAGRTKRPVLARSVEVLRKSGGRVLGSVLNRRRLEIPEFIYRRI
jgi:Mrp family chromosome partitioning ATPase